MEHDFGVRQAVPFSFRPTGQQEPTHGQRTTETHGANVATAVLHGVVDGQGRHHVAPGTVDVHVHVFVVLRVQVQHGSYDLVPEFLVDVLSQEDDPFPIQHVPYVHPLVSAFTRRSIRHLGHTFRGEHRVSCVSCNVGSNSRRNLARPFRSLAFVRSRHASHIWTHRRHWFARIACVSFASTKAWTSCVLPASDARAWRLYRSRGWRRVPSVSRR
mmetsp:Transcript_5739/g.20052  ORF Transcript_5739/g.20052 Transcript_5739/m.20052 type:complete len:215 (+) Transcript_5739:361-1005(+)